MTKLLSTSASPSPLRGTKFAGEVSDDGVEGVLKTAGVEVVPCPPTRTEKVRVVAEMMASGVFRRGKTARELATAWKMSLGAVQTITAEASRHVRGTIDLDEVVRTFIEVIDELAELAHTCKEAGEHREAIVALSKLGEFCSVVMKGRELDGGRENRSEEELRKYLIEKEGWLPGAPCGLPSLNSDNPSDVERGTD